MTTATARGRVAITSAVVVLGSFVAVGVVSQWHVPATLKARLSATAVQYVAVEDRGSDTQARDRLKNTILLKDVRVPVGSITRFGQIAVRADRVDVVGDRGRQTFSGSGGFTIRPASDGARATALDTTVGGMHLGTSLVSLAMSQREDFVVRLRTEGGGEKLQLVGQRSLRVDCADCRLTAGEGTREVTALPPSVVLEFRGDALALNVDAGADGLSVVFEVRTQPTNPEHLRVSKLLFADTNAPSGQSSIAAGTTLKLESIGGARREVPVEKFDDVSFEGAEPLEILDLRFSQDKTIDFTVDGTVDSVKVRGVPRRFAVLDGIEQLSWFKIFSTGSLLALAILKILDRVLVTPPAPKS
jgi:hypothetical protein